ncbi:unnamed protein product, partial [Prorocentrum cordatum]
MAPKSGRAKAGAKVKLSALTPSETELAAARSLRAGVDEKAKRGKMASMVHFLEKKPDLVRQKNATSTETVKETTSNLQQKIAQVHWWSADRMDREMGAAKAQHWRGGGKIKNRPDQLTGSTEKDHIEWCVPVSWEQLTESDLRELGIVVDMEADAESHANFQAAKVFANEKDLSTDGTSSGSGMKELAEKVANFKSNLQAELLKYQDYKLDIQLMITKAQADPKSKYVQ